MNKSDQVKKILFVSLSNIGDVILTTPTLVRLGQKYRNAKIDIIGDARSEILYKYCPLVDKFYQKNKSEGFIGTLKLINKIRSNTYDLAVDLRSDGLLYFIKADKKLYKIKDKNIHSIEKHFLSLKEGLCGLPEPIIWLGKKEKDKAKRILFKTKGPLLVIGLGANSSHKIWSAKYYAQLAYLLKKYFNSIVLIGDKKDDELTLAFKKEYQGDFTNLAGKLDLLTTAAVLKNADLFIGNDSGLGHIASAVKIKTFTIFGPGEPIRYRPWGILSSYLQDKEKNINNIKPKVVFSEIIDRFGFKLY
ncbi:MAG: glycosyltransferase family 9 protein [Methylophilaceae bacterium]|nr:glycosyltransferase family 9 protein [Methylophilaceae bacterium]